jgi:hypothetical protein
MTAARLTPAALRAEVWTMGSVLAGLLLALFV